MLKRIEQGRAYSPQELLEIGLELQRQNEQLDILCQNQTKALVAQRLLLDEADAATGRMPAASRDLEFYRRAVEIWGERLQVNMLAEEANELALAALKLNRSGLDRERLPRLAEEMADVSIMMDQALLMFPGLATMCALEREKKLDRLGDRLAAARA